MFNWLWKSTYENGFLDGRAFERSKEADSLLGLVTVNDELAFVSSDTEKLPSSEMENIKMLLQSPQFPAFRKYLLTQAIIFDRTARRQNDATKRLACDLAGDYLRNLVADCDLFLRKYQEMSPKDPYA